MDEKNDIFENMSFNVLINNISRNELKYSIKSSDELIISREGHYLLKIHESKDNLSQEDLVNIFCQSKGTVAKSLRKLEDKGYITREINKNNRRKYILKLTRKGEGVIPKLKHELNKWDEAVGVTGLDRQTMDKLKDIARKSYELVK
ncbi:MarR family transcriptional regulator [uncultured Methanobrevibacter sp.]|uniref:MarR family transcriptional regulator n=1 Tax=uncultured Methanobrevibacter sp. TaxID=253161 RepID=UPI0026228B63|nr:MarR family transcriptional regulator [uncultured Methanobrevibacter sp.]